MERGLGEDEEGFGEAMVNLFTYGHVGGAADWFDLPGLALSLNCLFSVGNVWAFLDDICCLCLKRVRSGQYVAVRECQHWVHQACHQPFEDQFAANPCHICRSEATGIQSVFLSDLALMEGEETSDDSDRDQEPPQAAQEEGPIQLLNMNCGVCGIDYINGQTYNWCLNCGVSRCDTCHAREQVCVCGVYLNAVNRFGPPNSDSGSDESLDVAFDPNELDEMLRGMEDLDIEWENPEEGSEWENMEEGIDQEYPDLSDREYPDLS